MKLEELQLRAYVDAVSRTRWLFLTTVLISGLILCHLYIEQFSFERDQLKSVYGNRIKHNTEEELNEEFRRLNSLTEKELESEQKALEKYSQDKYAFELTEQRLKALRSQERPLPLLGLQVPPNDYVTILSIFLVIFTMASWLSHRSVYAILRGLKLDDEFRQAVRFHFTFTGLHQPGKRGPSLAGVVQHSAVWLPAATLALAIPLDLLPPIYAYMESRAAIIGSSTAIATRTSVLGLCFMMIIILSIMSTLLIRDSDRIINES